ncbi:uncharacterized protein LOC114929606 [Nylanderia fulva]|uniref:uncharacterized protein LOC114929606 n=1 Tax=Nylanderia fulva TaxID=613905 RepID=UPI0010FB9C04|nr:uncharacterized protein LOC114929606 [Nylanderia fulva]
MDNTSVASTSAQVRGKRKKTERDSDTDDLTSQMSKIPCVDTDEESINKRITRGSMAITWNIMNVNTDSEPQSQSCSEAEIRGVRKPPKKPGRKKRSVDEPTIEQRFRPLPENVDKLNIAPVSQIRASAIEWLDDIEIIRANSNYQGALSGQIRKRVGVIKEILRVFGEKIEDAGDPSYLRRRNTELAAELASSKRETAKLRRDVQDLQYIVGDLKRAIEGGRATEKAEKATSPIEIPCKSSKSKSKSKSKERKDTPTNSSVNAANVQFTDVVMRPPLKSVSVPIPAVERSSLREYHDVDAKLSRRIVELTSRKRELRQSLKEQEQSPAPVTVPVQSSLGLANKPRITSNIQIVAPKGKMMTQKSLDSHISEPMEDKQTAPINQKVAAAKLKEGNHNKKRRPPKTAAVAIKGIAEGFSYAAAFKKLREEISLGDLQIDKSSIRHTANGGIVIEVPGKDKAIRAEALKEKVAGVLGETAVVTRPVVKGEVRIIGIDDSVVADEVADVIATAGDCKSDEVKVGIIRPMSNGLFTVWAQCPLAAAIKATQKNKIKIG